jgi:FtsH-binding integral membrane protein
MALGLALTAATAIYVATSPTLFHYLFANKGITFLLFGAQLALVISLSGFINRMSMAAAGTVFAAYSVLMGMTLSSLFFVYRLEAIYLSFGIAASMFALMAIYGYYTKSDLSGIGSLLQMALWGLLLALFINIFMRSEAVDYVASLVGVGVFTVLVAYDSQKIKALGQAFYQNGEIADRASLLGALTLYLDFINLFLFLLRIFGGHRRSE